MRITYLELENIKSYGAAKRIEFTPGLNAVCGLNGSGKTTVLEAIGYALFNFIPYKQEAFVREGAKYGTIRVGLLARDEREYEVVRRVGSSGTYYVCDAETGSRLADRQDAVGGWIREYALDMEAEADLASLFKNAVGVPQGLMTSDFQGTVTTRKSIFDPLLRVEEYRHAWEYLRETEKYLRGRTAAVDTEIARLEGETEKVPELEEQAAELHAQEQAGQALLQRRVAELGALEAQKQALDGIKLQLIELRDEHRGAEYDVRRHGDRLAMEKEALESAQAARAIVEESEPGFRLAVAARQGLEHLEEQQRERDTLRNALTDSQATARGIFARIQQLDQELADCTLAAEEATSLIESVGRQDAADVRLRELDVKLRDRERLGGQAAKLREAIADLQNTVEEGGGRIARATEAEAAASALPETQGEVEKVSAALLELAAVKDGLRALTDEGKQLKEQRDRLDDDVRSLEAILAAIEKESPAAAELDNLLVRQQQLRDRSASVSAAIQYQQLAREQLHRSQCPLLELQCPVVSADASLITRFDEREAVLIAETKEIEIDLASVSERADAARIATTSLQKLLVEAARLERSRRDVEVAEAALKHCREQYRLLSSKLSHEDELLGEQRRLKQEVGRLQDLNRTAAQLPLLTEQAAKDAEVLTLQRAELRAIEEERLALEGADGEACELRERLAEMGDPRRRQQERLAEAARKPQVEAAIAAEQRTLGDTTDKVKALSAALAPFETLDEQIQERRAVLAASADHQERYMRHHDEAAQIEPRRQAVETSVTALEVATKQCEAIARRLAEIEVMYDAGRHDTLRAECEEATVEVARERTRLEHLQTRLSAVQSDLAHLRRQQEKLRARGLEREDILKVERAVKYIRETINQAGPAVTETLLRNISQGANDIYEEIMDDHAAELRWDRNYEVLVQRGSETRSFIQLSGGEQMSAALAVRLALLKEMSEVDFAFFDEPTQNMDGDRRSNLADQIRQVRGFEQLIVISHDDTFEHHTDNLIRLRKDFEETHIEL